MPTLGSRLPLQSSLLPPRATSDQIQGRKHNVLVPTKPTSFGEFSSFLPSYDTKNSSMSFSASEAVWRYKSDERRLRRFQEWEDPEGSRALEWRSRNTIEEFIEEPPAAPAASKTPAQSTSSSALEEALAGPIPQGIDVDLLRSSSAQLELQEQINAELIRNSELVRKLQSYQWDRLRREYSRTRTFELELRKRMKNLTQDKNGRVSEKDALEAAQALRRDRGQLRVGPGEEEQRVAQELFDSLSKLIGSHDTSHGQRLIPDISQLRSMAASSATSNLSGLHIPRGFWGTLSATSSEDPSAPSLIVDNQTFRMTTQCEEQANTDAERNGEVIGTTKNMNAGLLDRIADTREYNEQDSKHDREVTQSEQRQIQPSQQQQQNGVMNQQRSISNNPGTTSPSKPISGAAFSPTPYQQQRVQHPTPVTPAFRTGSSENNQAYRPPYQQNDIHQLHSTPNGDVRLKNPLPMHQQMRFL